MAHIRPFAGIRYARQKGVDFSNLIAPPYDVLDEKGKNALLAKSADNIVKADLPFLPPKVAGPDAVYDDAAFQIDRWLAAGTLKRDSRAAFYPYAQGFEHSGRTFHRRGFIALVKLTPFGEDIIPHEKTYAGPIEDRMKLMRATGMQLSPIFGLFPDPKNEITSLLYKNTGKPEFAAALDNVQNDLWSVIDADTENQVIDLMKRRHIYIADGHHRYTTALQYQKECEEKAGGKLPANHPANFCMFVLVSMQDDGLLILPTHRLIGGLTNFDMAAFKAAAGANFDITEVPVPPTEIAGYARTLATDPAHTFGLYDGKTKITYMLRLKNHDVLKTLEAAQSDAWRKLDVAILQRYLLDEILQPKFAGGKELTKGYTADASTIAGEVDGKKYQLAILLQPTPLHALEELGKTKEVMPQKSTYFFPKLATGMVINPLK